LIGRLWLIWEFHFSTLGRQICRPIFWGGREPKSRLSAINLRRGFLRWTLSAVRLLLENVEILFVRQILDFDSAGSRAPVFGSQPWAAFRN
jgi:hypothetical protein